MMQDETKFLNQEISKLLITKNAAIQHVKMLIFYVCGTSF